MLSGKWLIVVAVAAILVSVAFVGLAYQLLAPARTGVLYGTLFINESGRSNVTSSATGSYNATLTAKNGNGTLLLTFLSGTNLIKVPLIAFSNYSVTIGRISMTISGHPVVLPWEDNDTVWAGQYNNNYVASWGPSAPAYEVRGQISPEVFGLPAGEYVEFRFQALGSATFNCC